MQNFRNRKWINDCQELGESRVAGEKGTAQVYVFGGGTVLNSTVVVHIWLHLLKTIEVCIKKRDFYYMQFKKPINQRVGNAGMEYRLSEMYLTILQMLWYNLTEKNRQKKNKTRGAV